MRHEGKGEDGCANDVPYLANDVDGVEEVGIDNKE